MEGALSGVYVKINELWKRKTEVDEKLSALREKIVEEDLTESLAAEIQRHQNAVGFR